jgi:MFS family permease
LEEAIVSTFSSLRVRNFRLFMSGQAISLCGTWMQTIAISWLVLQISHSGTILGLSVAAQFLPILLFGAFGGLIADRFNKRHVLFLTQTAFGLLSLTLGITVLTHHDPLWLIFVISVFFGLVQIADSPTRQSFVSEMVGKDNVKNAVTLNSTMMNGARIIGPSIGGIIIATTSVGVCFIVNAATFVAVIIALSLMNKSELLPFTPSRRQPNQLRAGFKYVLSEPKLSTTLLMMFIIGTFAYEFPVIFPLFATHVLHGRASTYSSLMAATGIGAVVGGLYTARRGVVDENHIIHVALLFGIAILLTSVMPTYSLVLACLVFVGMLSVMFVALGNSTLQLTAKPEMRGRVMSLWTVAFAGTTPIGGPIIGWISDHSSPRIGLATGGVSAIVAAGMAYVIYSKKTRATNS